MSLLPLLVVTALISCAVGLVDFACPKLSSSDTGIKTFCDRSVFNDVLMVPPASSYFFKDDQVALRLDSNRSIAWGYPQPITKLWPKLPSNFDAAFTYSVTDKTYFLKGSLYWRYTKNVLDEGFPMAIAEGFAGVPDNIDAATEWDKYIYFFKDNLYYRYDPCQNSSFTAPISDFTGLPPTKIDAVFRHTNGYAYFFIGDLYFHYQISASKINPPQPYSTGWEWFSCRWQ